MSVLVCQKADGEAASAKLNTLTHAYYVGILKGYVPAIYHGQDLGRGDRCACGLRLKARVRKVSYLTPRRNSITQCCSHALLPPVVLLHTGCRSGGPRAAAGPPRDY